MAHVTTNAPIAHSVLDLFTRAFAGFGAALVRMAESSSQMRQINALQALSDAELGERGLRRQDIAHYVFSGSYWV